MIESKLQKDLIDIFCKYNEIDEVILFGSRARGDNKYNSDVDLCILGYEVNHLILSKISIDIEEINTPLSFDILCFNELTKEALIENILKEGVSIYNVKEVART